MLEGILAGARNGTVEVRPSGSRLSRQPACYLAGHDRPSRLEGVLAGAHDGIVGEHQSIALLAAAHCDEVAHGRGHAHPGTVF